MRSCGRLELNLIGSSKLIILSHRIVDLFLDMKNFVLFSASNPSPNYTPGVFRTDHVIILWCVVQNKNTNWQRIRSFRRNEIIPNLTIVGYAIMNICNVAHTKLKPRKENNRKWKIRIRYSRQAFDMWYHCWRTRVFLKCDVTRPRRQRNKTQYIYFAIAKLK